MQLSCAWDGNNPRFLRKEPSERDLGRRCLLLLRELVNQINQRLIRLAVLGRKARNDVAEVGLVELRFFADRSSKETLPQRAKWNEPDPQFLEGWYHFCFRLSPPKR